ncbi:hypothetical protein [Streptomyces palmae]|uniref:DUF892 family protein n=1 Tax=Streptomyces palmae TaxID=1701085 RepID=A0A4Z0GWX1_9ACTN|nr:hypothetical protein [Streptomyces palmae]TGB01534.1 hypothetical protein E4099_21045 [Streptomyces palmae]
MNRIGTLFADLHHTETALAGEFRGTAERHPGDHGTHRVCRALAQQCEQHTTALHTLAQPYGVDLAEARSPGLLETALGAVRHAGQALRPGHQGSGLSLLHDLRRLYQLGQRGSLEWTMLAQAARALRDQDLLGQVTALHRETLGQLKWIRTRVSETAPQILAVDHPQGP